MADPVLQPNAIEKLPREILVAILSSFKTKYLHEVCSKVSIQWRDICKMIIENRVRNIDKSVSDIGMVDIKCRLLPNANDYNIICDAEATRISSDFSLQVEEPTTRNFDSQLLSTTSRINFETGSGVQNFDGYFKFMNSHNLVVVFNAHDDFLYFYDMCFGQPSYSASYTCIPNKLCGGHNSGSGTPCFRYVNKLQSAFCME